MPDDEARSINRLLSEVNSSNRNDQTSSTETSATDPTPIYYDLDSVLEKNKLMAHSL